MFQESGIVFLLQVSSVTSSSVAAAARALLCSAIRCQCHVEFFFSILRLWFKLFKAPLLMNSDVKKRYSTE